jgi:membrane protein insertase Oxa1/YidC/SpoIIIJ
MLDYETVATWSQVTSLLMFIAMAAGVAIYALWPSNGALFNTIQRHALDLDRHPDRPGQKDTRPE